ncbi:hypothetical protein [Caballeronia sp. SL2Y3]|uniref:hypothetical protein n=1 Tax=Caballeronia sp. SL2Y3 TaxID=2878151 RepID=UPI001FCF8E8F|nr:hypothetical protein [Caballeronia sp. SL2Y3]
MQLQPPPFDADVYRCADWLELKVLSVATGEVFFSDIERAWEARREAEEEDFEGQQREFDLWLNAVCDEVETRRKSLGSAYPFEFNDDESGLTLGVDPGAFTTGAFVYLFCLMLSTIGETQLFEGDAGNITPEMRDLFQACAAWAAAGVVAGCAYAFGWPRPERNDFLTALRYVYHDLLREGVVVNEAPPGASLQEKDGGIDVIAWSPRPDFGPGQPYLIGQVATGENWQGKSVEVYIKPLHLNWFVRAPRSVPQPAMFIPFCIKPRGNATVTQQLEHYTPMFGSIYYRLVLPEYAARGLKLAAGNQALFLHRTEDLPHVQKEVTSFIARLAH